MSLFLETKTAGDSGIDPFPSRLPVNVVVVDVWSLDFQTVPIMVARTGTLLPKSSVGEYETKKAVSVYDLFFSSGCNRYRKAQTQDPQP